MIIKFKNRKLFGNLLLGAVWVGIGLMNLYEGDHSRWSFYVYLALGILYIGHFITDITYQYLTIQNGILSKNWLYGMVRKMKLSEIISIEKKNNKYILRSDHQKLTIKTGLIEEKSLDTLNNILAELKLSTDENVVTGVL